MELAMGEEVIGQVPESHPTYSQYRYPLIAPIIPPRKYSQFYFTNVSIFFFFSKITFHWKSFAMI